MSDYSSTSVIGLILAGGKATRMDGVDKGLVPLEGKPLVQWVNDALSPQVAAIMINANRNQASYAAMTYTVIQDDVAPDTSSTSAPSYRGPLAGMLAGMRAVASLPHLQHKAARWMATVPCDSPFVPPDMVARFLQSARQSRHKIVTAHDGERIQPVFNLVELGLLSDLEHYLGQGGRKIDAWFAQIGFAEADFSDTKSAFININTEAQRVDVENSLISSSV